MLPRHRNLLKALSQNKRRRFLLYLRWLYVLEKLDAFADWYAWLPYTIRRKAFRWADRTFYPAHWVGY